ncbi:hypothetical protein [Dyella sp. 20L07]|uniref:hypothetical protein n=1 Tax=Dyella sp. 20L07 TaxID=3384240 RepID=UPI003D2E3696
MNAFDPHQLAQAFGLRIPLADDIIHRVTTQSRRRWWPLTALSLACGLLGIVAAFLSDKGNKLTYELPLMIAVLTSLTQMFLVRRAARQPILDAAQAASSQNN